MSFVPTALAKAQRKVLGVPILTVMVETLLEVLLDLPP